jgi:hypothetical protein
MKKSGKKQKKNKKPERMECNLKTNSHLVLFSALLLDGNLFFKNMEITAKCGLINF